MTTTDYLELEDQATGANNNTWGDVADANMGFLELAIARRLSLATTGGSTTLTTAQNRYPLIRLTGILVSNATIVVRTAEKHFVFINDTTGAYTVTVKTTAGTGKTLPRGRATRVYCDGTNVELARHQSIPHAAAGGTVDAITATFEPAWTAAEIQDGTMWIVEAGGANTSTTPNFTPDGGSTYTIKKFGAQALAVGDIRAAGHKLLLMYDASGGHVELLNPTASAVPTAASTTEFLTGTNTDKFVTPNAAAAIWEAGSDVSDGAAITIGEGGYFNLITSTTAITSFSITTDKAGRTFRVRFDTARTLTHNATSLIIPGGANVTTAQGDIAQIRSLGSGNVVVDWYTKADGTALVVAASGGITQMATVASTSGATVEFTGIPSGVKQITMSLSQVSLGGSDDLMFSMGDSGGFETSNYLGCHFTNGGTPNPYGGGSNMLICDAANAGNSMTGTIRCTLLDAATFLWLIESSLRADLATDEWHFSTARKALSAELTQVRLLASGANNFDAGSVSVQYAS